MRPPDPGAGADSRFKRLRAKVSAGSASATSRAAALAQLDRVPVLLHLRGCGGVRGQLRQLLAAEDVRVAAHQLLAGSRRHVGEVALPALLEQQRQEVDLEQHVAELVQQLRVVTRVRRVGQLVGLLDGVRDDAALVLLAVPGTLASQAAGDRVELEQRLRQPLVPGR